MGSLKVALQVDDKGVATELGQMPERFHAAFHAQLPRSTEKDSLPIKTGGLAGTDGDTELTVGLIATPKES